MTEPRSAAACYNSVMWPLLLLLACGEPPEKSPAEGWRTAIAEWTAGNPLPSVDLKDANGRAFSLDSTRGQWLVIGFIYTRCPKAEACPLTMTKLVALDTTARGRDLDLQILAVTLDPEHDTPEVLRAYGERIGVQPERFTLATGPTELVSEALPSLFNVIALPGEAQTLDHTVRIALIDPTGRTAGMWSDSEISSEAVLELIAERP